MGRFRGGARAAPAACALIALFAQPVLASSGGIARFSGKQGPTCNACHAGGTAPAVRFEGPTEMLVGSTATFRFVLTSEAPSQDEAGLNVAASAGTLAVIANQRTRLLSGEVAHSAPQDIDDEEVSWEFNWTAPATPGEQTLWGAGNAVNGNGNSNGDRSSATTVTVQVVGDEATSTPTATIAATQIPIPTASPTPTHTLTVTATATQTSPSPTDSPTATTVPVSPTADATPTPTETRSATPTPTDTFGPASSTTPTPSSTPTLAPATATHTPTTAPACVGDCNTDRRVTVAELVTGVNIALDRAAVTICRAIDRDGDGRATVAELVEAVSSALQGCEP